MCVFRVSPFCGGMWSSVESVKRVCTTWAERCTRWASHIWPYITTRRHLHCLLRNWRCVYIQYHLTISTMFGCSDCSIIVTQFRKYPSLIYSGHWWMDLHPQLFFSPVLVHRQFSSRPQYCSLTRLFPLFVYLSLHPFTAGPPFRVSLVIRWIWGGRLPSTSLSSTRPVETWRWPTSLSIHTALFEMHTND